MLTAIPDQWTHPVSAHLRVRRSSRRAASRPGVRASELGRLHRDLASQPLRGGSTVLLTSRTEPRGTGEFTGYYGTREARDERLHHTRLVSADTLRVPAVDAPAD